MHTMPIGTNRHCRLANKSALPLGFWKMLRSVHTFRSARIDIAAWQTNRHGSASVANMYNNFEYGFHEINYFGHISFFNSFEFKKHIMAKIISLS